ncbi:hypothetical protein AAHC03_09534 [Spirometra sp. Aus1]
MSLPMGRICMFCRSPATDPILGDFVESGDIFVHINCLYTASGLVQQCDPEKLSEENKKRFINGFDSEEVKNELRRGRRLRCRHCGISGACVGCSNAKCRGTFHLPCLYKANGFAVFRGNFPAYCSLHRPLQDLRSRLSEYQQPPECCICLFGLLDVDEFCQNKQKDRLSSTGPYKHLALPSQISTSCSTASSNSPTPENLRKHITIVDGGKPLTPVRSRRSSVRKFTSIWEVNNSSVEDSLRSLVKLSKPELATTPEEAKTKDDSSSNWFSRLFSDSEGEGVEQATPSTASKPRQPSRYALWSHAILHGQCCRPAWMHRDCITGYAKSAGLHHVKCPLCFNRDTFIETLFTFGVWIPDRDAAWELEPGAFDSSANPEAGNSAASSPSTIPATTSSPDENAKPAAPSTLTTDSPPSPAVRKGIRRRRRLTETGTPTYRHGITRRRTTVAHRTPLSEVQPACHEDGALVRLSTVDEVCHLDTESEGETTPIAVTTTTSSAEATLSGSPSILSVLKYPSPVSPRASVKLQRRRRNTGVPTSRGGSHRQVYQRHPSLQRSTDNGLRQTSISAYFTSSNKVGVMDATNELFKSLLTTEVKQSGGYSLRSGDTGASSQASSLCLGRSRPSSQQTL